MKERFLLQNFRWDTKNAVSTTRPKISCQKSDRFRLKIRQWASKEISFRDNSFSPKKVLPDKKKAVLKTLPKKFPVKQRSVFARKPEETIVLHCFKKNFRIQKGSSGLLIAILTTLFMFFFHQNPEQIEHTTGKYQQIMWFQRRLLLKILFWTCKMHFWNPCRERLPQKPEKLPLKLQKEMKTHFFRNNSFSSKSFLDT